MKVAVPILDTEVQGKRIVNAHVGQSKQFAIVNTETGKTEVVENPGLHLESGRGIRIAETLRIKGVDAVLVKEIGAGSFDKIRNRSGIEVYLVPPEVKFLDDAVEKFKNGELQKLLTPKAGGDIVEMP